MSSGEKSLFRSTSNSESEDFKSSEDEYKDIVKRMQTKTGKVYKKDFTILTVIGTGSFGKVYLVKKNEDGKLYAMKVLKKSFIRSQK
jgi:serine/threonine protein kinase